MKEDLIGRQPQLKMSSITVMEDINGPQHKWKGIELKMKRMWQHKEKINVMEEDLCWIWLQQKAPLIENDLNGRQPQWKMTSITFMEDSNGPQHKWKGIELKMKRIWQHKEKINVMEEDLCWI
jgi:hypothetical protein